MTPNSTGNHSFKIESHYQITWLQDLASDLGYKTIRTDNTITFLQTSLQDIEVLWELFKQEHDRLMNK
jgi:hypothetical protein